MTRVPTFLFLFLLLTTLFLGATEPLRIRECDVSDQSLDLLFNRPFENEVTSKEITISPKVEEVAIAFYEEYAQILSLRVALQPQVAYTITVHDGEASASVVVVGADHPEKVVFSTGGTLFPLFNDFWELPVTTENIRGPVRVSVYEAYPSLLLQFLQQPWDNDLVRKSTEVLLPIEKSPRNRERQLAVDLAKAGIPRQPGFYRVVIEDADEQASRPWWRPSESRTVIVTDLGILAAGGDGTIAVAVQSLRDNTAVADAVVTLYTRKLQAVATAKTGADGSCRLTVPLLEDREDEIAFLFAEKGSDRSFCRLTAPANESLLPRAPERAELFWERGVCRPGEQLHAFASMRDKSLRARGGVPAEFTLRDPRGAVVRRAVLSGDEMGLYDTLWTIPANAPTGGYELTMGVPGDRTQCYGRAQLQVGEYLPDQIRVELQATESGYGDGVAFHGKGAYYFGSPVKAGKILATLEASQVPFRAPMGYEKFVFGSDGVLDETRDTPWKLQDSKTVTLREDGTFDGAFGVAAAREHVGLPVEFRLEAVCTPTGAARTVTARTSFVRHYADYYLGGCAAGDEAATPRVRIVALTPDGLETAIHDEGLRYELFRCRWSSLLKRMKSGSYERVWEQERIPVAAGDVELTSDGWLDFGSAAGRGSFLLVVRDTDGRARLKLPFWYWGGEGGQRVKDPRALVFDLNQSQYRPGESAVLSFESPFEGVARVMTADTSELLPVSVGKNSVRVAIPAMWLRGSYPAAVSLTGRKDTASDPQLLQGVAELPVSQEKHHLKVELQPEKNLVYPGEELEIQLSLSDADGAPISGEVILWGVDEGVLALTAYKTPDLFERFFGAEANRLRCWENYALLYPVMKAGTGLVGGGRAMGAAFDAYRSLESEKLEKCAAVCLGVLKLDDSGRLSTSVRLPDHTGAMRLMAVGVSAESTGCAETSLLLRRELSLFLRAPRVVAPGDCFRVAVQGFNHDLDGVPKASWSLAAEDAQEVAKGIFELPKGGDQTAYVEISPKSSEGVLTLRAVLSAEDGAGKTVSCERAVSVVVRPPVPPQLRSETVVLQPGEERDDTVGSFGSLQVGSPILCISGSLRWLAEYPYGCLEQSVAAAFPQLAVPSLVAAGLLPPAAVDAARSKVELARMALSAKRVGHGWLSMWEGDRMPWQEGSLFTYLFLLSAENSGFPIEESWRAQIVENLRLTLNRTAEEPILRATALLDLALASPHETLVFSKLIDERTCDGFCRFLKAVALVKGGYAAEGMPELEKLLQTDFIENTTERGFTGLDSLVRRYGLALWLLGDLLPADHPAITKYAGRLLALRNAEGHWGTTQQNAWAALGLAKWLSAGVAGVAAPGGSFCAEVAVDGAAAETLRQERSYRPADGKTMTVHVRNAGTAPIWLCREERLAESTQPSAVSCGLEVRRELRAADGKPVGDRAWKRGEVLQVVLKVVFRTKEVGDFVVVDLLPGCLEIEDENLLTRSRLLTMQERRANASPLARLEKRFDRFLGFGSVDTLEIGKEYTIRYQVRVTGTGRFAVPPTSVESMYRPALKAVALPEVGEVVVE